MNRNLAPSPISAHGKANRVIEEHGKSLSGHRRLESTLNAITKELVPTEPTQFLPLRRPSQAYITREPLFVCACPTF